MEILALLFGLFLVVLLGLLALAAIMAALQGITLVGEADKTLAFLCTILILPVVIFGVVFWLTGNNWPQKFMDDFREKQRKDSGESDPPASDDHEPDVDPGPGAGGGDNHDNTDHAMVETSKGDVGEVK